MRRALLRRDGPVALAPDELELLQTLDRPRLALSRPRLVAAPTDWQRGRRAPISGSLPGPYYVAAPVGEDSGAARPADLEGLPERLVGFDGRLPAIRRAPWLR
jgi:hypothetical protein